MVKTFYDLGLTNMEHLVWNQRCIWDDNIAFQWQFIS
jgi:hypothetical protein